MMEQALPEIKKSHSEELERQINDAIRQFANDVFHDLMTQPIFDNYHALSVVFAHLANLYNKMLLATILIRLEEKNNGGDNNAEGN